MTTDTGGAVKGRLPAPPGEGGEVLIPKPGRGTRQLGKPAVLDRFIQQTLLQILTLIFDTTFSAFSYGFRPGRSLHQAVCQAKKRGSYTIFYLPLADVPFIPVHSTEILGAISMKGGTYYDLRIWKGNQLSQDFLHLGFGFFFPRLAL